MRSGWKINAVDFPFYRENFLNRIKRLHAMKLWTKGTPLFSDLLGKNLFVYNGAKFTTVFVKKGMVSENIGCFALTKRITSDIHSKTKRNKKGRRKKKK